MPRVGAAPPAELLFEEHGRITVDGAGKVHIVTRRVSVDDIDPQDTESGEVVDARIVYRSNESGEWVEQVLTNFEGRPLRISVSADGDVTVILSDSIYARVDGVWSMAWLPGDEFPHAKVTAFDPLSNSSYMERRAIDEQFVLGGPPDCLQRIIAVEPAGCEPELELTGADVGESGTLDLLARGPTDPNTGLEELVNLHVEAGALTRQILAERHTDTHYFTLAAEPDGTLHTCAQGVYDYGKDADSWTSVEWQEPGFNTYPDNCLVAATDAGEVWLTWIAFAANADADPSYSGHVVDGQVELELMGTVTKEGVLSARSIALGPDGEPHVLAQDGLGHRYFFREAGEWTSLAFTP